MLLTIDPSINSMGAVLWENKIIKSKKILSCSLIKIEKNFTGDWTKKVEQQTEKLIEHILRKYNMLSYNKLHVIIEMPVNYISSAKGISAINSGSILKLTYLVGYIIGSLNTKFNVTYTFVSPNEWKGQLPKEVVIKRIKKLYNIETKNEWVLDIWDAIGIGLWYKKLF